MVQRDLENNVETQVARIRSITISTPPKGSPAAKSGCDYQGVVLLSLGTQETRYYHYPGGAANDWTSDIKASR